MDVSEKLSQKMSEMKIDNNDRKLPEKKFYEVATTIGKLTIQVTRFTQYIIIIVTYSGSLKLEGYLQIAYPTPYSQNPTVLNLEKDQGQMDNEKLAQRLSKQTKCPILLSFNIDDLNKNSEQEIFQLLKNILNPKQI